jgi:hypothetical protein
MGWGMTGDGARDGVLQTHLHLSNIRTERQQTNSRRSKRARKQQSKQASKQASSRRFHDVYKRKKRDDEIPEAFCLRQK